jgi:hypothetical protein
VRFWYFLEQHTGNSIPDESTLRKNYIPQCYDDDIRRIRESIRGKKIFVSIEETSDVEGRYIANVIIGTMVIGRPGKILLLTTESLDSINHSTIDHMLTLRQIDVSTMTRGCTT